MDNRFIDFLIELSKNPETILTLTTESGAEYYKQGKEIEEFALQLKEKNK